MTRRAPHHYADDYDSATYDERQERVSASEQGRKSAFEVGGWWTPGSWGRGDE